MGFVSHKPSGLWRCSGGTCIGVIRHSLAHLNTIVDLGDALFIYLGLHFSSDSIPIGALDDYEEATVKDDASNRET